MSNLYASAPSDILEAYPPDQTQIRLGLCVHHRLIRRLALGCTYDDEPDTGSNDLLTTMHAKIRHVLDFGVYLCSLSKIIEARANLAGSHAQISATLQSLQLDARAALPLGIAFVELICNAIQHAFGQTKTGGIGLHLWSAGDPPRRAYIIVADNGCGFSPASFHAGGIETVRRMVTLAGSRLIWEPGKGTLWRIELDIDGQSPRRLRESGNFRVAPCAHRSLDRQI